MRDLSQLSDLKLALVQTTLVWHDAKATASASRRCWKAPVAQTW